MDKSILKSELLLQVGIFLIVVLLGSISFRFGIGRLTTLSESLTKERNLESILIQKEELLTEVGDDILSSATVVSAALPPTNSSLAAISQIKLAAARNSLVPSNIKVGSEVKEKNDISRVDITLDVDGSLPGVINFATELSGVAPIITISKLRVSGTSAIVRTSFNLRTYWSAYPTKLSALTEKVNDLTSDEAQLFEEVAALTPPSFLELNPSPATTRIDPFN